MHKRGTSVPLSPATVYGEMYALKDAVRDRSVTQSMAWKLTVTIINIV